MRLLLVLSCLACSVQPLRSEEVEDGYMKRLAESVVSLMGHGDFRPDCRYAEVCEWHLPLPVVPLTKPRLDGTAEEQTANAEAEFVLRVSKSVPAKPTLILDVTDGSKKIHIVDEGADGVIDIATEEGLVVPLRGPMAYVKMCFERILRSEENCTLRVGNDAQNKKNYQFLLDAVAQFLERSKRARQQHRST